MSLSRSAWLAATLILSICPIALAIVLAPPANAASGPALVWLLFIGSSAHVGATGWFYTVPQVRAHMGSHPRRYVWVPLFLIGLSVVIASMLSPRSTSWLLLGFFGWQFMHFQKQNLGVAALAARAWSAPALSRPERSALVAAGLGGIAALLGHPHLLQVDTPASTPLFQAGTAVLLAAGLAGMLLLVHRKPTDRPLAFVAVYLMSLLFFLPVVLFQSPYAAVAGLTVAHGFQYLLLVGMLAASPQGPASSAPISMLIMVNIALLMGLALNRASHLHGTGHLGQAVFGAYLGVVMAHFVIDAGLWRLRDEFPRAFLTERLPFLLSTSRA